MAPVITALAFLAALSLLAFDNRIYNKNDAQHETLREARYALGQVQRDLTMAGYGMDRETLGSDGVLGQPVIVWAGPYDLVFNADIDGTSQNAIRAIRQGHAGARLPTGYAPATFVGPAETVRYTLDSNDDGAVDESDHGDDADEQYASNSGLYALKREVWGWNGVDDRNPSATVALVRGPVKYPSDAWPEPLFQYWGYFRNHDHLDLWGDANGDGRLDIAEIEALTPVTGEDDEDGDGTLDPEEDRNGDNVRQVRISDLIRTIDVRITAETIFPDLQYQDSRRSGATASEVFRFHSFVVGTEVMPKN